jgi:hypothetical protein
MAKNKEHAESQATEQTPTWMPDDKQLSLLQVLIDLNVSHQEQTLTYDNLSASALLYLIDMGLKQSLGDLATTTRPAIVGEKQDGTLVPEKDQWKDTKRLREAIRLGFTAFNNTIDERKALATAWIKDATAAKFTKILSGELSVGSNGPRMTPIEAEMFEIVSGSILGNHKKANDSLPKAQRKAEPTVKELRQQVMDKFLDAAFHAKVKALAERRIAERDALEI